MGFYRFKLSPHISLSPCTKSCSTKTFIPPCFLDFFRSSFVTSRPGVIGVTGVKGMYGL